MKAVASVDPRVTNIKYLARAAAFIHFVCLGLSFVMWLRSGDQRSAVYELYRPAFVANSTLVTAAQSQLAQSCARAGLTVLTLQAEFAAANSSAPLRVRGTWVPAQTTPFWFVHMNGYHLLWVIFGVSFLAQANVVFECRKVKEQARQGLTMNYDFFTQPCASRWFEYAVTSPCMVSLIAASLAIRDINTILLLAAAQGALCQFGFAMECAYELRKTEGEEGVPGEPVKHIEFRPFPVVPSTTTIMPNMSQQLWYWSFVPSMLLHVLVWGVLISSYVEQTNTRCADADGKPPDWLVVVLILQAVFFSFFVLVAVWQALKLDMVPLRKRTTVTADQVKNAFFVSFKQYTVLSLVAKAMLGLTYLANVGTFPLYTPQ